jgi:hypothetical protein
MATGGCASSAADIAPAYVSPVAYQSFTCEQLALEAQSISTRAATLSGAQDKQRTNDRLATAAAVVIFWPAAFFVGGDKLNLLVPVTTVWALTDPLGRLKRRLAITK